MITFDYIEEYLEVLAGFRQVLSNGKAPGPASFYSQHHDISLARYDINIVQNMAGMTYSGTALTDRQSELAIKLVDKYKKQFASYGIDVTPSVRNPQFRLPLRVIDRSRTIKIVDDQIVIKFPYDKAMVPEITQAGHDSRGQFKYNKENKSWNLALTEYNINWACAFGNKYDFTIDSQVQNYMDLIMSAEKTNYKIELGVKDHRPYISNAAGSLIDYITKELGGFTADNLLRLVDYAPVLGYSVSKEIIKLISQEFDPITSGLLINRESHVVRVDPTGTGIDLLKPMVDYCQLVDRWPLCVYEPDTSLRLRNTLGTMFEPHEILDVGDRKATIPVDFTDIKVVYFSKMKRTWHQRIPILVSTNAMLYGGEKQAMLQAAEKVVYYTATTYNKEATQIAGNTNHQR